MSFESNAFSLGAPPIELYKKTNGTSFNLEQSTNPYGFSHRLDVSMWLAQAAEKYHLSNDLNDYLLVPVPSVITSIPNTNGDSMNFKELTEFKPDYGVMAYKTWIGKPTHEEHDNKDITKAKGVILDVYLRPIARFPRYAKVVKLLSFDRTKDPKLCDDIINKRITTYSMGMWYSHYNCSICNAHVGKGVGRPCHHTAPMRPTYKQNDNRLVYRMCRDITGFETSAVRDPAYHVADQSDNIWNLAELLRD